jgi:ATP-grasp in the biosynthetic pathway with Ter operon
VKRILVFPCGSEIGLEIYRSVNDSRHFHLIGGSSTDDHGRFVFEEHIPHLPFSNDPDFIEALVNVVEKHQIDAIYPTMDAVSATIKEHENHFSCRVIGSSKEVACICASKKAIYSLLKDCVPIPNWSTSIEKVTAYPVFIKPDRGYGSRNTYIAKTKMAAQQFLANTKDNEYVLCEYLPGDEFTVDCFSSRDGELMFAAARERSRISNGISTNTKVVVDAFGDLFQDYAIAINLKLKPRGAWFFQMKVGQCGSPKLLEVAARLAGSSALFRSQGVNFALLSLYDAFEVDLTIVKNSYTSELDRALTNRYFIDINYDVVYVGLGDCLVIDSKVNIALVSFIFSCINESRKVILIAGGAENADTILTRFRINQLFDEVVNLNSLDKKGSKFRHINPAGAIFIDGSFTERLNVSRHHKIPVFSPDMIEALM